MSKVARAKPRSHEQRRRETQKIVLDATLEVLIKRGYAKLTLADVAEAAGVSRGAQMNYFRTKIDLVNAAARHAMVDAVHSAQSLAERASKSSDPLDSFLMDSEQFFLSKTYLAMIELAIAARTDPLLGEKQVAITRGFRKSLNAIWLDLFVKAGYPKQQAEVFLKLTHYLFRGMALVAIWSPTKKEYRQLLHEWRSIIREKVARRPGFLDTSA